MGRPYRESGGSRRMSSGQVEASTKAVSAGSPPRAIQREWSGWAARSADTRSRTGGNCSQAMIAVRRWPAEFQAAAGADWGRKQMRGREGQRDHHGIIAKPLRKREPAKRRSDPRTRPAKCRRAPTDNGKRSSAVLEDNPRP